MRTGSFVIFALALAGALAYVLVGRHTPVVAPPRSVATLSSGSLSFPLVGVASDACVTTVQAGLEAAGFRFVKVSRESASVSAAGVDSGVSTESLERSVIERVRASGHEVQGSEGVIPRLAPLTADEVAKLDALTGEWLEVRCKPPACLDCSMKFEERVKELAGVREVVVVHFRDHLAVKRDPQVVKAVKLAEHIRALTHEPVTLSPTKAVEASIANMTCNKCIGSIRGRLMSTKAVLSPTVEMGHAKVIVESGTAAGTIKDAIESAPGPECKSIPVHTFRANITSEKQD